MNRYDKEDNIIEDFHSLKPNDIMILPQNIKTILMLNKVYNEDEWKKWINSSSKKDPPPDYYNRDDKLMMDVMRIDDHAYVDEKGNVINPHLKRESELIKELSSKGEVFKRCAESGHIFITPDTGLSSDEDHNYEFYKDNFNRVIGNHVEKISKYNNNHPGYKMIFFVLDESSPYIELSTQKRPTEVGERIYGKLHFWWQDSNMINNIINSGIDYLIWMTPYKHFDSEKNAELPKAVILDVDRIKQKKLTKYKKEYMQSLEL